MKLPVILLCCFVSGSVAAYVSPSQVVDWEDCDLKEDIVEEIESYQEAVDKIIDLVVEGEFKGRAYDILAQLTDQYGARMSSTQELEDAIDWIVQKTWNEGLHNIRTEAVKVPTWVRNNESLSLIEPREQELNIIGLGSSVATPEEGIIAEVFVVNTFEQLEQNADKARGKIVLFHPVWTNYMEMVQYRGIGANKAAEVGAVAALVGSVTPFSIDSPHTGGMKYQTNITKIPSAAITQEDARMFQRLQNRGQRIVVHLFMGAQTFPESISRNTLIDLRGKEIPEEIVVVSGHIDSWDVGVGAMDDGGGIIVSWLVPVILKKLGLTPRRTIRTVLFTGEEQGLLGGKDYFEKYSRSKKERHQLLLESDSGTFNPSGIAFSGTKEEECILAKALSLLEAINTTELTSPLTSAPDISFWGKAGFPTGSLSSANERYFWFHHTRGDRVSIYDPEWLDKCAAMWTAVAYIAADISTSFKRRTDTNEDYAPRKFVKELRI